MCLCVCLCLSAHGYTYSTHMQRPWEFRRRHQIPGAEAALFGATQHWVMGTKLRSFAQGVTMGMKLK